QHYRRAGELAAANERLAAEITERTKAEESLAIALEAADMEGWEMVLSSDAAQRSQQADQMLPKTSWGQFLPEDAPLVSLAFEDALITGRIEFERRMRRTSDG